MEAKWSDAAFSLAGGLCLAIAVVAFGREVGYPLTPRDARGFIRAPADEPLDSPLRTGAAGWMPSSQWSQLIEYGHVVGPANSPIVAVLVSDYFCQRCRLVWDGLRKLQLEGKPVAIVVIHFPYGALHPLARLAAAAAECAGQQGRFLVMHELLFEDATNGLTGTGLRELVRKADLSTGPFEACLEGHEWEARIHEHEAYVRAAALIAPPAVWINQQLLVGLVTEAAVDSLASIPRPPASGATGH